MWGLFVHEKKQDVASGNAEQLSIKVGVNILGYSQKPSLITGIIIFCQTSQ